MYIAFYNYVLVFKQLNIKYLTLINIKRQYLPKKIRYIFHFYICLSKLAFVLAFLTSYSVRARQKIEQ